ncbi:MAG: transketolase C-terminal domain-containing protein, partial [Raoultibacter sp.]
AERLSATGIALRVVNVSTIKPLDQEGVWKYASDVKAALTAEEHSVIGGLGSAICEALSEARVPVRIMGIRDSFGRSATAYDELLVKYGLTVDDIISNVQELLK